MDLRLCLKAYSLVVNHLDNNCYVEVKHVTGVDSKLSVLRSVIFLSAAKRSDNVRRIGSLSAGGMDELISVHKSELEARVR